MTCGKTIFGSLQGAVHLARLVPLNKLIYSLMKRGWGSCSVHGYCSQIFLSIFGYKQEFSHLQKADLRLKLTIFQRFSKFSTTFSQASSIAPFRL
jgi:hypothetical protein